MEIVILPPILVPFPFHLFLRIESEGNPDLLYVLSSFRLGIDQLINLLSLDFVKRNVRMNTDLFCFNY